MRRKNKKPASKPPCRTPLIVVRALGCKEDGAAGPPASPLSRSATRKPNIPSRAFFARREIAVCLQLTARKLPVATRAALRTQLLEIWKEEDEATAAKLPRNARYIFEIDRGTPIPRLPIEPSGLRRIVDGKTYFSLKQTAKLTRWSESNLRACYDATWGDYLPKTGGAQ